MNIARTVILLICAIICVNATGEVIYVPTDQPTIQAGINAASNGDTVLVADGTWTGEGNHDIDFGGKAITLCSENGPQVCIMDIDWQGRGFQFVSGEGPDSVVQGFTIRGGAVAGPQGAGGAIRCVNSSPTIRNNIISYNRSDEDGAGGGIYCTGSSAVIIENIIHGNSVWSTWGPAYGGGIYCRYGNPVIANNRIYDNDASSISYYDGAYGGGIYLNSSNALMVNNLIYDNTADDGCGGIAGGSGTITLLNNTIANNSREGLCCGTSATVTDCIIWGNSAGSISGSPAVTYSNIEGGFTGTGNIDLDPLFVSAPDSGYYLGHLGAGDPADSPCIDRGSDLAENLCYTVGPETVCMNTKPTRRDKHQDVSTVDMGYHHAWTTLGAELTCVPSWGTLPMICNFGVFLHNQSTYPRTFAGRLDVILASGTFFSHYRAGWTNMTPLEDYEIHWPQNIPLLEGVTGTNTFTLVAQDVTPAPYNQPPDPPSGDTDQAECTVVGSQEKTLISSVTGQPDWAVLPFTSEICIELQNNSGFHRQLAYEVARTMADGTFDPNYRSGFQNVAPYESYTRCWEDSFPDDESSNGLITYQVLAEDVTPPPYNQPPNPAAGDTHTSSCTVEGATPPYNTWYVDDDNCPGPGSGTPADPFCTIQQGIDAAVDFDTVLVADGTYTGLGNRNLDFGGKPITVASMNGPNNCIIDSEGSAPTHRRAFYFHNDEGPDSIVQGLTITGGYQPNFGGGISCSFSSPTITNCRFIDNQGAGLQFDNSAATVSGCVFSGNQNEYDGGAIIGRYCIVGVLTFTNCVITGNHARNGGGIDLDRCNAVISNCLIAFNTADEDYGGVRLEEGDVTIVNCSILGHFLPTHADGAGIGSVDTGDPRTVVNTIVWGNSPDQIHNMPAGSVTYCNVEDGYPGAGNIDADPLFVSGPSGNFYLGQVAAGQPVDSPCLDAGSDLAANICFITATGIKCLDQFTTRTDGTADAGQVDIGYHYASSGGGTP